MDTEQKPLEQNTQPPARIKNYFLWVVSFAVLLFGLGVYLSTAVESGAVLGLGFVYLSLFLFVLLGLYKVFKLQKEAYDKSELVNLTSNDPKEMLAAVTIKISRQLTFIYVCLLLFLTSLSFLEMLQCDSEAYFCVSISAVAILISPFVYFLIKFFVLRRAKKRIQKLYEESQLQEVPQVNR